MTDPSTRFGARFGRFVLRVLTDFRANQGLLLAGAVAYYTLLSLVPLLALVLVGLSHFIDAERLLHTVDAHLALVVPAYSSELTEQLSVLVHNRDWVGGIVLIVLLVFSSFAFTVLENALAVIFHHRTRGRRRRFLVSVAIPYVFVALLGVGVLVVTFVAGALQRLEDRSVHLFGTSWSLSGASGVALYAFGVTGIVFMLTAFYLVMPVQRIRLRHALIGGVTAGVLWEATRHVLIWYFAKLSVVNVVYGSFAGTIVALLSFEIGALILLLGAQVIAEFERSAAAN